MIKISISDNFLFEKKYIIDVLLGQFLGLKYHISISKIEDYHIRLENGNKLVIRDHFFSGFKESIGFLNEENIPKKVRFVKNEFMVEMNIPVIYGDEELSINKGEIICGIDVFSSSFFMVTRWEEHVNKTRDIHGRFPAIASLAYRNRFLERPIVNEYVEMLWNMFLYLGCKQKRKEKKFRIFITHDVDQPFHTAMRSPYHLAWRVAQYIRKNRVNLARKEFRDWVLVKMGRVGDAYDTYDWIMDQVERFGIKSAFYFKATRETGKFDPSYDLSHPLVKSVIKKILRRGHEIGFHPGYYTANNREKWAEEWHNFKRHFSSIQIKGGRQHFLRFHAPLTWRFWSDAGLEYDSSLSFADHAGFRCGVSYEYTTFDFIERKRLKVKEKPLLIMEKTLLKRNYMNLSEEKFEDYVNKLRNTTKRYNGDFIVLWHTNNLIERHSKQLYCAVCR
jgi:hypothetical protein